MEAAGSTCRSWWAGDGIGGLRSGSVGEVSGAGDIDISCQVLSDTRCTRNGAKRNVGTRAGLSCAGRRAGQRPRLGPQVSAARVWTRSSSSLLALEREADPTIPIPRARNAGRVVSPRRTWSSSTRKTPVDVDSARHYPHPTAAGPRHDIADGAWTEVTPATQLAVAGAHRHGSLGPPTTVPTGTSSK